MKVSVRVRGEWLQVPCKTGDESVTWLGEESLRRYMKLKPSTHVPNKAEKVARVRKTRGGAILDPSDSVADVLDDNDFVSVVLDSDRPNPVTEKAEVKYVTEQLPGRYTPPEEYLTLDGATLTPEDLMNLGKCCYKIRLSQEAEDAVKASRELVDTIIKEKKGKVTSGQFRELQLNLIRSHAAGVGAPLSAEKTRMLLALRVNILAKGYSGISPETLHQYIDAFNASCLPWVPEKGTVGASGDLAPLAHLALGMLGEGKMWSHKTGWGNARYVLEAHNLRPMKLGAKEGIALINGTQLITSITAEALERAETVAKQADVVAALTLEVLKGTSRAFDSDVHKIRHHKGQIQVARRMRALLHSDTYRSEIAESHRFCDRVQDAYTLRCTPQVHGIVHDTLHFVRGIITDEMNAATDNPLVLVEREEIISAGNFHGEYPAKAADYLAIAIHEIASMSERRIERLVNPALSELPAFLVKDGGLNSGFMIPHCTAASLVSENKVLTHPASVDSLTTSAGTEDHVSMGGFAARKALMVVENVEHVITIELLAACQAIRVPASPEDHGAPGGGDTGGALRVQTLQIAPSNCPEIMDVEIPLEKDRFMAPDIDAVAEILRENKVWQAVKHQIEHYHAVQDVETRVFSPSMSFVGPGPRSVKRLSEVSNGSRSRSPATPKKQRTSSRTSN
ncbi:Histidine ammonia-lyase [Chionoecetes opilio]|uniref:Histidine ammonia-lyase n=1 Tax=Chionoecetes opilio TaxID=41210 RepID=A0A8J5CJD7_CHIOP|nr:Histidine ammonia-lyase [Chionoecetes opilio]